jgi:hypothetical protein
MPARLQPYHSNPPMALWRGTTAAKTAPYFTPAFVAAFQMMLIRNNPAIAEGPVAAHEISQKHTKVPFRAY